MDKDNLFVKIDYVINDSDVKQDKKKAISNTKIRNSDIKASKYLIGGGVYNKNGGTIIFKAKNLQEVKNVTSQKPLVKNAFMRYDVVIIPKSI
ncbi:hypothetical protein CPAST_c01570 [Clostridium pasteurianum DSM 525 = ATCC 6013]|uniref:Uncharacterized protein n=1 Tax=Clostridium pasteurianum DSM 525 = ATCC 6013 TaxID=1262449 RepID=A0A0H3J0R2_CLOPA|nr:hypothetical protein [Clostridium pasteurianum]AJA46257.1 hypothetical protein CPAST_c01570 [Clostridium pasteurianum DSM 525 = ATCC 6013]AJA50245.1 hypothetical protein CLPA_c01570 [Clostridium pasteurianum DSM 525 = ATCC 6013]AOZ73710.1 hypothetical protein AQ983_00770 [Clostridium pasteurianum DSM 525 = ATCC 6013]AOZ77507.1 hypothetical protein AQ984_00770 [Clostridium pasteurianum]ELP60841.1 hypothetical protein F502_00230 [Clostridium pasteurianum DSM 525 = ATCC 6013]